MVTTPPLAQPPPTPCAWMWKCHHCHSVFPLGCTRRCLECGHEMCSFSSPPAGEAVRATSPPRPGRRRPGKRRRTSGPCCAEFDYSGWEAWGSWKRGPAAPDAAAKEASFVRGSYACANLCDYPSECHHTRRRVIRKRLAAEVDGDDDEREKVDDDGARRKRRKIDKQESATAAILLALATGQTFNPCAGETSVPPSPTAISSTVASPRTAQADWDGNSKAYEMISSFAIDQSSGPVSGDEIDDSTPVVLPDPRSQSAETADDKEDIDGGCFQETSVKLERDGTASVDFESGPEDGS